MVVEQLNSISNAFLSIKSDVTGEEIVNIIESELKIIVPDSVLYNLLKVNVIKTEKVGKDISKYTFSIIEPNAKQLTVLEQGLQNYLYISSGVTDKLVWSYPKGLGFERLSDFEQLYPALCSLIANTTESIWILNPFFDNVGVERIGPYLKAAVEKGISIKILTGRPNFDVNVGDTDPLRDLVAFISVGRAKNISVKHFFGIQGGITYSVHAKLMIFDSKKAYLGSANLTQRSLSANIEVGVIISDGKVKALIEAFESIWGESK